MEHFKRLDDGLDTSEFLIEIEKQWDYWDADTSRQENIPSQKQTAAISLFCNADSAIDDSAMRRARPIAYRGLPTPFTPDLPSSAAFAQRLVTGQRGKMGRAGVTKLQPNGAIQPHIDDGLYWLLRDRFHLVVKSPNGSLFKTGGQEVRMREGELWWFDPTDTHSAYNDSNDDRIHIIIDVLSPKSLKTFGRRMLHRPNRRARALAQAGRRGAIWHAQNLLSR